MNQKWYEKNLAIVLLLIFFFPVGLFLMWKYSKWNKVVKIVISILLGLIVIGNMGSKNANQTSTTKTDTATVKEQPKEKTEEEKAADEAKKKADEEAKAKADAEAKKAKEEADAKAAAEAAKKAEEEKVAYDTGITYNQLARNPDDYKGKKAKFTGKVIQVVEGDKETDLRIAVDGNYDTVLYVGYDPKISSSRILENDNITVKGKSLGIYSYKSTLGGKISIPSMWIDNIVINNK